MNPNCLPLLATAALAFAACSAPTGSSGPDGTVLPVEPPLVAPPSQSKPSYELAKRLSDQIKVGMPQSQVESMFGPPDKAGYQMYGRQTPTPWRALVWEYVFEDANPPRALSIAFQEVELGVWKVNHGDWPAP